MMGIESDEAEKVDNKLSFPPLIKIVKLYDITLLCICM